MTPKLLPGSLAALGEPINDAFKTDLGHVDVAFPEIFFGKYDIVFLKCQRATLTPTNKPREDNTPQRLYSTQKVENGT
jgi:hypothetical protein